MKDVNFETLTTFGIIMVSLDRLYVVSGKRLNMYIGNFRIWLVTFFPLKASKKEPNCDLEFLARWVDGFKRSQVKKKHKQARLNTQVSFLICWGCSVSNMLVK